MTKGQQILLDKILYFTKIGEIIEVNAEDISEILIELRKKKRTRKFKYSKAENNYHIWRTK